MPLLCLYVFFVFRFTILEPKMATRRAQRQGVANVLPKITLINT